MSIELREKWSKDIPKNLKLLHDHSHPQIELLDAFYKMFAIDHTEYKNTKELSELCPELVNDLNAIEK